MAGKASLHEYQSKLAARLAAPEAEQAVSKLGFRAADTRWVIDLADASEVIPVPPIAAVPLTHPWFLGVANVRGYLYGIVDLPAFLGSTPVTVGDQARVLLIGAKYRINCGLLLDRVLGLYRNDQLRPAPEGARAPWTAAEYSDTQGNKWKQLNLRELIVHPDFLQVGV